MKKVHVSWSTERRVEVVFEKSRTKIARKELDKPAPMAISRLSLLELRSLVDTLLVYSKRSVYAILDAPHILSKRPSPM